MGNLYRQLQAAAMLAKERNISLKEAEIVLDNMYKHEVSEHDREIFNAKTESVL